MHSFVYEAADEEATAALGSALAPLLPPGTTVALCGTLGSGKTRLVQAIARASGVTEQQVVSPTFVLIQEYQGYRPVYHFDAYRIRNEQEFLDLGPEEYFDSDGVVLIEWADRVERCLPTQRIEILLDVTGAESRRFEIRSIGGKYDSLVERLQAWAGAFLGRSPI